MALPSVTGPGSSGVSSSRYRSLRAVPPPNTPTASIRWSVLKIFLIVAGASWILSVTWLHSRLDDAEEDVSVSGGGGRENHHGVTSHLIEHREGIRQYLLHGRRGEAGTGDEDEAEKDHWTGRDTRADSLEAGLPRGGESAQDDRGLPQRGKDAKEGLGVRRGDRADAASQEEGGGLGKGGGFRGEIGRRDAAVKAAEAARERQERREKLDDAASVNGRRAPASSAAIVKRTEVVMDLSALSPPPPRPTHLSRGHSGLPLEKTPALVGASRGHIECDVDVDALAYWNEPQGDRDSAFVSPFRVDGGDGARKTKYLTFEPDTGGWNNIRMSMEIIFVIAAATGRTIVLPPAQPLYLLNSKKGTRKERDFGDFYPLRSESFRRQVNVLKMDEFLDREGKSDGLIPIRGDDRNKVMGIARVCENRKKSDIFCGVVYEHIKTNAFVPPIGTEGPHNNCLVFDKVASTRGPDQIDRETTERIDHFCQERKPIIYGKELQEPDILHFQTMDLDYRLLNHFYAFIFFTDPVIDNHYKRFVRDFMRYNDAIYCAAGKIVRALQEEGRQRGFDVDEEGGGGYSALHVRRGDLQYKEVKFGAEQWYQNTKDVWAPNEILYVATDEKNKTFFDPLAARHTLRYLDDYWDMAGLGALDSTYMGMIDTIVASRGRAFAGTWFSTFSGFIIRMRGYHGMTKFSSYYGWTARKTRMHHWAFPTKGYYPREWPIGWVGIDGDEIVSDDFEGKGDIGPLARGVSGLPMSQTPALVGAKRGHIDCDVDVDALAYWNHQGKLYRKFRSPFAIKEGERKYVSFQPDGSISPGKSYLLRFDGGSRGNPGPAGAGFVLYDAQDGSEVWSGRHFLDGPATNNVAEYTGLVIGLRCARSMGVNRIIVEGDSDLIVKQLKGIYRVKNAGLKPFYKAAIDLKEEFESFDVMHIPRGENGRADELANEAMDMKSSTVEAN